MARVVELGQADLGLFSEADQALLTSLDGTLGTMVADGPEAFDGTDVSTLLAGAINVVSALRRVPCQKF